MGIRFRKSIKIIPGVRLNFSGSGVSTTVGVRGASVNVSSRGVTRTIGIPGTGISDRQMIRPEAGPRQEYRVTQKQLREIQREIAQNDAAERYKDSETHLDQLVNILKGRSREFYDWEGRWRPRGAYIHGTFVPPQRDFTSQTVRAELNRRASYFLPSTAVVMGLGVCLYPHSKVQTAGIILLVGGAVMAWVRSRRRVRLGPAILAEFEAHYLSSVEERKRQYEGAEFKKATDWGEEEARRERVYRAAGQEDYEALTSVIEEELQNESLPVALLFDVEFESPSVVHIQLTLPDLGEIPEKRATLTKTGKLSEKVLTVTSRAGLYADLCAGLAMRIVYEGFRVLPMAQNILVNGSASLIDPATGHEAEKRVLTLSVSRSAFESLDLDHADPSDALRGLGGTLGLSRFGELAEV